MKTALVTGGAKRIGAGIVRALAEDGWRVLLHYNTSASEAEALASSLTASGGAVETIECDLSNLEATLNLIPECNKLVGPLDCLINNASLFEPDCLTSVEPARWQRQLDVNLRAPTLLTKAFAKAFPEGRKGCIINMLDNKIFSPNPDYFSYSIGKFGLKGLTEMAAMSLGPRIRVCGIAPGLTTISGDQTEEDFERQSTKNLLERSSDTGEIAKAVRFILGSRIFNGQIIVVDGGQTLLRLPRDVAFLDE
jgi:NAD(P)-dependent dehydrogenase (short-subunit alcohol dehydrogenase family)